MKIPELWQEILLNVHPDDLPELRLVSRQCDEILTQNHFWRLRFAQDGIPLVETRLSTFSWIAEYRYAKRSLAYTQANYLRGASMLITGILDIKLFFSSIPEIDQTFLEQSLIRYATTLCGSLGKIDLRFDQRRETYVFALYSPPRNPGRGNLNYSVDLSRQSYEHLLYLYYYNHRNFV